MPLTIRTNNVPRDVLYWHELSDKERAEFDYLDTDERQSEATFFRYRGHVYDLGEFLRVEDREAWTRDLPEGSTFAWDGYQSDSYFSGVLIRYVENFQRVIAARYYA